MLHFEEGGLVIACSDCKQQWRGVIATENGRYIDDADVAIGLGITDVRAAPRRLPTHE